MEEGRYLEDVISWLHVCDVNPLTVDVSVVGVIATGTQSLLRDEPEVREASGVSNCTEVS